MSTFLAVLTPWQHCRFCGLGLFYRTYIYRPLPEYAEQRRASARRGIYIIMYKCVVFAHRHFFSSSRVSFLVLSAPGHAGSPPEHHGASVGPDRGPWHVLWGFKVASNHGEVFRARRAIQAHTNPRAGYKNVRPVAHVVQNSAYGSH